jgi:dTDP-4-dehydrorhamnose reductase
VRQWAQKHETLRIVDDQVSSPTWARTLAEIIAQIMAQGRGDLIGYLSDKVGIYHLAGGGDCSRYEWAQAILATDPHPEMHVVKELIPAKSDEFPTPAQRPLVSILDCEKIINTFQLELPDWKICQSLMSQT